jgi:multiple sugar transport system permease protein
MSIPAAQTIKPVANNSRRLEQVKHVVLSIIAIVVALIFFLPIFWAFSLSLRNPGETFTVAGFGIPYINFTPTLQNWADQLQVGETQRALVNSSIISGCTTLFALLIGMPAAYALARFRFNRWKNQDLTVWFLSQRVLPPIATLIGFIVMIQAVSRFIGVRLTDSHVLIILFNITFTLPFIIVILRQTFADLPVELEEAALVDGATYFGAFLRVALPLAAPAVAAAGLIVLAFTWNEFLFSLQFTSRNALTIPVHMAGAVDTRGVQFWFMGVRACIAMIPPALMAILAQRYIVQGLTLGAVRG